MKIAFLLSSIGDIDLALKTIKSLEHEMGYEIAIISLTKIAQQRVESFQSPIVTTKITLPEILQSNPVLHAIVNQ